MQSLKLQTYCAIHPIKNSRILKNIAVEAGLFKNVAVKGLAIEYCGSTWMFIFIVVPCCMLFQSLLYCSNSCTSLHFKTLKSHTKTLKIPPYMFRSPLKPSSGGPWPYFARLLNWNVDLHSLQRMSICDCMSEWTDIQPHTDILYNKCKSTFQFSNVAKYGHGPSEDGFKGDRNM